MADKSILFLLVPGFLDGSEGPYFCPDSALVEGFLRYAPEVAGRIDVRRIEFPRPRKEIVELIGTEHQSCPVLVLPDAGTPGAKISEATGRAFISGSVPICEYLAQLYGVVRPHP